MIIDDMISTGHASALLAIEDEEQQFILANKVFDENQCQGYRKTCQRTEKTQKRKRKSLLSRMHLYMKIWRNV